MGLFFHLSPSDFNPLPRKEGDTYTRHFIPSIYWISIHSLVKRETPNLQQATAERVDFNPLPRKEGDSWKEYPKLGMQIISIHSLVKRETERTCLNTTPPNPISIHSLVKRETRYQIEMRLAYLISIHSLVKRETTESKNHWENAGYFNPLPRKEGDYELVFIAKKWYNRRYEKRISSNKLRK